MRSTSRPLRRGVALLEVIVALAVLVTAGASVTVLAVESTGAVQRVRLSELENRQAVRFFETVSLWPQPDLDRHLGIHAQGSWQLEIQRASPHLYTVVLRDSLGVRALLRTNLYRPGASRDST
jgi:hypothetical protein